MSASPGQHEPPRRNEPAVPRWDLFRLLSDQTRLSLLALCAAEELAVGELGELLGAGQPAVSRHSSALREAGLLLGRKQGSRLLLRLAPSAEQDPVVAEALEAGRALCLQSGALAGIPALLEAREAPTQAFFDAHLPEDSSAQQVGEWPAYVSLLASLLPRRELAVDVGCGAGVFLDVLAPVFTRVVAADRSETQLRAAGERVAGRGYDNVKLVRDGLGGERLAEAVAGQADVVFANRVLHHTKRPADAVASLASLARRGGRIVVLDYLSHQDERLREAQADLWLGFDREELLGYAGSAGLTDIALTPIPKGWRGAGADARVPWVALSATRA